MAKPRRNPTLFPEVEVCTKCGAEMMLVRSEPSHPGGCDLRTFECSECNNVDQYVIETGTAKPWILVVRT
jgi:hypothetical protein